MRFNLLPYQLLLRLFVQLTVSILLIPPSAGGQQIAFNHLTVERGLSQNSVLAMAQDYRGFIWLGTRYGLNRYDGYNMRVYQFRNTDSNSLSNNYILSLLSDKKNNLWVGTLDGLNRYDVTLDRFIRIPGKMASDSGLSGKVINCLHEDQEGRLWVGTDNGLNLLMQPGGRSFRSFFAGQPEKGIAGFNIRSIFEDSRGILWVGTSNGLLRMDLAGEPYQYKLLHHEAGKKGSLGDDFISTIAEDAAGTLWFGTQNGGISLLKKDAESFVYLTTANGLTSNNIRKIFPDSKERFWIGTLDGLTIIDPLSLAGHQYRNDPANPQSLAQNSIYSILQDNSGSVWLGTYFGGVSIAYSARPGFEQFRYQVNQPSISNNVVSALSEDNQGHWWIGTEGGGLTVYSPAQNSFRNYRYDPSLPGSLPSNLVKSVFIDSHHQLWVGTHGGGLNLLNPATGNFRHFFYAPGDPDRFNEEISVVKEDPQQRLWIGAPTGLLIRKFGNGQFQAGEFPALEKLVAGKHVKSILFSRKGDAWLGTGNGLQWFRMESGGSYTSSKLPATFPARLATTNINCLFEDGQGNLWIGLYYNGLVFYNPRKGYSKTLTSEEGLPNNNVLALQDDAQGNIWISTANGLCRLDTVDFSIKTYNTSDGLTSNEFNYNAAFRTRSGKLAFGSIQGLNVFDPAEMTVNEEKARLYFTSLRLFNKPVPIGESLLKEDISFARTLDFAYDQNVFSIGFSLLNFIKPEKNRYAYKLEGLDHSWNETSVPQASFTNLPPGHYKLVVKGANNDGTWSDPISLALNIRPPFWKSVWAYLLYFILVTALVLLISRYFLVRALLQRDKALHQLKLNFFTNVSHEIKTHLTLITGPVENLLEKEKDNPVLQARLSTVKSNADRLLTLVRELLDFRKAESNQLPLHPGWHDLRELLEETIGPLQELVHAKNIRLQFRKESTAPTVWIDKEQMAKVFHNLLFNALRFTPEGGTILVGITEKPASVSVSVTDNGKGIPKEFLPKIFNNFFQVHDHGTQNTGYGIGLALSKSIIELHKGSITAQSREAVPGYAGETTFLVTLPKSAGHQETRKEQGDPAQDSSTPPLPGQEAVAAATTILVVEDNEEIRQLIEETLKGLYEVLPAANGQEGWRIAAENLPDLIISDVMMPEMDGFELCRLVKTDLLTSHIPVILLTAKTTQTDQLEGLENGADSYLFKPFSTRVLELQVRNLLHARELLRQRYAHQIGQPEKVLESRKAEPLVSSRDEAFMQLLSEKIETYLEDPKMSVPFLAEQVHMSQSVLYKKIKALTGMSVNDFIKTIRLKKAASLILDGQMAVYEVAYAVGFSDRKYFSREFKKHFGVNPTDYGQTN